MTGGDFGALGGGTRLDLPLYLVGHQRARLCAAGVHVVCDARPVQDHEPLWQLAGRVWQGWLGVGG